MKHLIMYPVYKYNSIYLKGTILTLVLLFLYQIVLPLMILVADTTISDPSLKTKRLKLTKYYSNTNYDQYSIIENDMILIKRIERIDSKFVAGYFIDSDNNYIKIGDFKNDEVYTVNNQNIEVIYVGNVNTWNKLRKKWNGVVGGSAFALGFGLWLFMSDYDMAPAEDLLCASMLGAFYAAFALPASTIASYLDYEIRKGNARKFIIGYQQWQIN